MSTKSLYKIDRRNIIMSDTITNKPAQTDSDKILAIQDILASTKYSNSYDRLEAIRKVVYGISL